MAEALLTLRGVRAGYGDGVVLEDISFAISPHQSLAVLGRNGAGKSTLLLTIMGHTRLRGGSIAWHGRDITRLAPHLRARGGLGWVAQERDIFPSLTVVENLTATARPGPFDVAAAFSIFPRLAERRQAMGHQLSGGEQQMLAIARALMTNPELLLLDEPLEGLAPIVVEELAGAIRRLIAEQGMTIVLVEQHADIALGLTENAIVLERGRIVHSCASRDLLADGAALERLIGLQVSSTI